MRFLLLWAIILSTSTLVGAHTMAPDQEPVFSEPEEYFIPQLPPAPKQERSLFDIFFGGEGDETQPGLPELPVAEDGSELIGELQQEGGFMQQANIRVIDKSLGVLYERNVDVGKSVVVKELHVKLHSCWRPNGSSLVSNARALFEISFHEPPETPKKLFYGWMFANAQALNPLIHPKYDVTIADCVATMGASED